MGRGGGGGGSHHSSHHSSSHSHHSSSRRSSGSYSHHSGRSHYSSSSTRYRSGSGGGGGGGRRPGCGGILFVYLCIFLTALGMAFAIKGPDLNLGPLNYFMIERSTTNREPLPESKCDPIDEWYQDDWGDWIDEKGEEKALINGLQHFYDVTGVQPYLWITGVDGKNYKSEGSLEDLGEERYKEMFGDDEGHVLVIFREYPNASSEYICTVTPGYDAEVQIMDDEAREILLDFIDYYYTSNDLNEGEFFAKAFEKAGDRMMIKQLSFRQITTIIAVAIVAVIGIVIVASIIKKRKVAVAQQKAKQAQAEADKVQTEFNQQQYQDALEKEYVSVTCPNCGATANKIRKGTVDYCKFCGTAISVDAIGQAFIGDIYNQQQNYPPQS